MKAIKATRQVTKAMELVAASKMRRAAQNAQVLRRYAWTAWRILERLAETHPELHPYLSERPVARILAVLFTSDRGLCGSLHAQLFRTTLRYLAGLRTLPTSPAIHFVAVGRKGQQFLARERQQVIASFPTMSNHPIFTDTLPLTRLLTESFLKGEYDHIVLLYPDCISALVQEPTVKVLLPLSRSDLKAMLDSILPHKKVSSALQPTDSAQAHVRAYLFEPSPASVLSTILPQLTEVQVYQAVLEMAASEHSARMVAMRNASDSASDLLDDLTLTYNQTRQEKITVELSEISAARAALTH